MADRFPLILNTSTNQIQEIPSGDNLDLTGVGINNAGIITASSFSGPIVAGAGTSDIVAGIITATQIDLNGDIDVDGHTNLDNVSIAGVTTFASAVDVNADLDVDGHTNLDNVSVGGATTMSGNLRIQNAAPHIYLTDTDGDDYSINVNGGNFEVRSVSANSSRLQILSGGTVRSFGNFIAAKDLDVDGHTNLDNLSVSGVATVTGNLNVGGVLTYEDVTNVDSVGLITAREGVFLPDLKQLKIGNTAAAPDLYLWHNSSTGNSNISNKTGDLFIQGNNGSGTVVNQIAVKSNAAVELNYQGNKKFETKSTGAAITGTLDVGAIDSTVAGADNMFTLETTSSGDPSIFFNAAGAGGHRIQYLRGSMTLNFTNGSSNRLQITAAGHTIPGTDSLYDLGLTGTRWRNVYADTLYGDGSNLTGLNTDLVSDSSPQLGGTLDVNGQVISFPDSNGTTNQARFGTGNDLKIYHQSNSSYIINATGNLNIGSNNEVRIKGGSDVAENMAVFKDNGSVELYHDSVKKFETTSTGVTIVGDLFLDNPDHGGQDLLFDSSAKTLKFDDGVAAKFGTGTDLSIYHNGNNSYIDDGSGTGALIFKSNNYSFRNAADNEQIASFNENGAVELFHDNSKRFNTVSQGGVITGDLGVGDASNPTHQYDQGIHVHANGTGAVLHLTDGTSGSGTGDGFDIISHAGSAYLWQRENSNMIFGTSGTSRWNIYGSNGHLAPSADNTYDIGTTSVRVRNLYVNDLQLSNKAKKDEGGNDVDGTWGDWTLQEGESDVYMINNRSGKKFRIKLEEVL